MRQPITLNCELFQQNLEFLYFSAVEIRVGLNVTDVVTDFINLV